jgi:hypothetical protein
MPPGPDRREPPAPSPSPGLLSVRAAVVLLLDVMMGVLVGVVCYVETSSPANALSSGVVVSLIALRPLNKLIGA